MDSRSLAVALCLCLLLVDFTWAKLSSEKHRYGSECPDQEVELCPRVESAPTYDWTSPGVFDDLTMGEIQAVLNYMLHGTDIHLRPIEEASLTEPFIYVIELIPAKKHDVLQHLDNSGPSPIREARVVVYRGDLPGSEARIEEYRVGPLPNPTYYKELRNSRWKYPIPFTARPFFIFPLTQALNDWAYSQFARANNILEESTGYKVKQKSECDEPHSNCLVAWPSVPGHVQSGQYLIWFYLTRDLEGGYLYPVGMQILVNAKSPSEGDWTVERVWYQGQYFNSLDDMLAVYEAGDLVPRKLEEPEGAYSSKLAASMNFRGDPIPEVPQGPTKSYYPDGQRYKIRGHHVEWMGWEMDVTLRMTQGLLVHDIRYRGERIAYEISLQEISVLYSSNAPGAMHTEYYDSVTLTGTMISQLYRGIDCPDEAAFFDFPLYLHGRPFLFKNVACVFESDRNIPLRRHQHSNANGGFTWAQGMRDIVLITRAVFTVDNYDYITDIILHQGGQVEVKASLSGYTLNTYYSGPEQDKYGHQTQPYSLANVHLHAIHFKADLDIGGRINRFQSLDIDVEEQDDPVFPGFKIYNRIVTRNLKQTEKEAAYKYSFDNQGYLVQFNQNIRNKMGYPKGYRIAPVSISKLLLPEGYRGEKAMSWMKYQVAVTKYNDDEIRSSCQYATMDPFDPVMSFQDFIDDNDSIVDQDLVSWITLGVHHIPHSEDVPVVLTPGVQLTFFLLPYNYFDEDPSLASRDNIRVSPADNGENLYQYSGIKSINCCKPRTYDGNGHEIDCFATLKKNKDSGVLILSPLSTTLIVSFLSLVLNENGL